MRHRIDPKVDCVFKALLGSEENLDLLIHFLNAALATVLPTPIVGATILNPFNDREFKSDKLSVVDVKARDDQGQLHQIEVQMVDHPYLPSRMLYGWADLFSSQLKKGKNYAILKPTYAIWLLAEDLLPQTPEALHHFHFRSTHGGLELAPGGIRVLELNKFRADRVETELDRWMKFFQEGKDLYGEDLPVWMQTAEMTKAMDTLRGFSEKERAYYNYQSRQNYLHEQRTIQLHTEALKANVKALESNVEVLESNVEVLESNVEVLESNVEVLESNVEALESNVEVLEADVKVLEADKKSLGENLEQALGEIAEERAARERERAEKEAVLAAKERERAEKESALAEIERLKAKLAERDGE